MLADHGLLTFRDPFGIRPIVVGERNGCWAVASESVALDLLGYRLVRDLCPGEAVFFDLTGGFLKSQIREPNPHYCIFEWVYFARPDSILDGIGVYEARLRLGKRLAEECKHLGLKPDVVMAVPDTARAAALPIAQALGVDLREGLIKNRYIARTFIMPSQRQRINSVHQKLNPIRSEVASRKILLVDDSIVRGTTSREIVAMMRRAKAKEVYLAITCPPLRYPCIYGIDMATRGELVARTHSIAEIREFIGADELIYQTLDDMVEAVGEGRTKFCTACFSGEYPTCPSPETMARVEAERRSWQVRDEVS
jgi:amidophosphoribosyltransferase